MEKIRKGLTRIKTEHGELRSAIKEKTAGYILAALGFVASLAWNEAIKSLIDQFFPSSGNSVFIKFAYAFLITVALVIFTIYLLKFTDKQQK